MVVLARGSWPIKSARWNQAGSLVKNEVVVTIQPQFL